MLLMAVKAFFLLSIIPHIIHAQTDVWYEQMNTDPAASTWTGTAPLQVTGDATNCPSPNDYCWSVSTAGSYSRVDATSAFTFVEFTYSINIVGSLAGPDTCVIEYSVDDSVYDPIETIDTNTLYSSRNATFNTWTGVAGIPALYIRIRYGGNGFTCYLNEFRLHGTPATSSPSNPSSTPTKTPTAAPSSSPSHAPTTHPSGTPTDAPSGSPSQLPSTAPSGIPSDAPSGSPSQPPTTAPSGAPVPIPTTAPTSTTNPPSSQPTPAPTDSSSPTQTPTEETASPTLGPTDPPTSQYCARDNTDGNVHCYSSSVYSIYTYTTSSYYVYIQRYDGDATDIYDVHFTAWSGVCYAPHINVRYRSMQTHNGLSILDDNDGVIGSCSAERDCNSYLDCLIDYDLGLDRLEYRKTYRLTLFGRNLVNYCSSYSYYTIDAYIEFICDAIPTTTLPPTGVPTTPTTDPTTALPTQPTLDPTPNPTLDVADGSDVFTYYIISCIWKDNTYSLILMTVSGDGVYLGFDLFLESPIPRSAITSSLELKDDSYCIDSDCTQFWDIKYSLQCDIALNGIWKAQFSTNCNGDDYIERKECLDYLSSVGITANKAALNSYNEFALNDELCIKSLYSKVFTPIITYYKDNGFTKERTDGNSKYKVGDTVYVDIAFIDEEYDVNDVSIGLIFGCELGNSSRNITESQALDGITPCLLNTPYIIQSDSQGGHVWFTLPFTKSEQFAAQIQAIINVNSKSKQIRHLMLNIVLNGKANAASRAGAIGRGAIAAIVIAVILILCIVIVAYYKYCRPHNNNNNKAKMDDAVQLEAVKSISQNETSPTTEVQAAAVVTKGEGKAPKKTVSKSKAPKKAELAAAAKKAGSGGGKKANANRKEPKKKLPSAPVASKDKKAHKNKNKKQQNTGKKKKSGNKNKGKKVND